MTHIDYNWNDVTENIKRIGTSGAIKDLEIRFNPNSPASACAIIFCLYNNRNELIISKISKISNNQKGDFTIPRNKKKEILKYIKETGYDVGQTVRIFYDFNKKTMVHDITRNHSFGIYYQMSKPKQEEDFVVTWKNIINKETGIGILTNDGDELPNLVSIKNMSNIFQVPTGDKTSFGVRAAFWLISRHYHRKPVITKGTKAEDVIRGYRDELQLSSENLQILSEFTENIFENVKDDDEDDYESILLSEYVEGEVEVEQHETKRIEIDIGIEFLPEIVDMFVQYGQILVVIKSDDMDKYEKIYNTLSTMLGSEDITIIPTEEANEFFNKKENKE